MYGGFKGVTGGLQLFLRLYREGGDTSRKVFDAEWQRFLVLRLPTCVRYVCEQIDSLRCLQSRMIRWPQDFGLHIN